MYGPFKNEELVGRAIRGRRDQGPLRRDFDFHVDRFTDVQPRRVVDQLHVGLFPTASIAVAGQSVASTTTIPEIFLVILRASKPAAFPWQPVELRP